MIGWTKPNLVKCFGPIGLVFYARAKPFNIFKGYNSYTELTHIHIYVENIKKYSSDYGKFRRPRLNADSKKQKNTANNDKLGLHLSETPKLTLTDQKAVIDLHL